MIFSSFEQLICKAEIIVRNYDIDSSIFEIDENAVGGSESF